ncbi:MAG: glycosyltransferase family 9 protein [Candidatus Acidiferrales bacterium]
MKLGSLGDIVHTLPAASALRESFPRAQIDWLIDRTWLPLLEGNADINQAIPLRRGSLSDHWRCIRRLRAGRYECVLDFQSLYKSAMLAMASGAPRILGFERKYAREGVAALFYSDEIAPRGEHKVEHNLSLAEAAGAQMGAIRFPICISEAAREWAAAELANRGLRDFFVLNPGGGWKSKCWPPERFGELHRRIAQRTGWSGIVSFGPGEENLANEVASAAGDCPPVLLPMDLPQLIAVLARARIVVAADTGPLHLAAALGTPVVGLYGPTDPARNGPYASASIVLRNARAEETNYERSSKYSSAMLSISVAQVEAAVEQCPGPCE